MGCDIHLYVEKKDASGKFIAQGDLLRNEDGIRLGNHRDSFYNGRNYDLFAILADVRNGRGFAGVETGAGFKPIEAPRGIPENASKEYLELVDDMGRNGYSHSFFTLRELLDYDWTKVTLKTGLCNFENWEDWSAYKRQYGYGPDSYCGDIFGSEVKKISSDEMDALCKQYWELERDSDEGKEFLKKHARDYSHADWEIPYYRAANSFLSETIPRLLKLANGTSGLDDVRIVFFFDN